MQCILFSQFDSLSNKPHRLVWDEKPGENTGAEGEGATAEDEPATVEPAPKEPAPKEPGQRPGLSPEVKAEHSKQAELDSITADAKMTFEEYKNYLMKLLVTEDPDKIDESVAELNKKITPEARKSLDDFIAVRATEEAKQNFRAKFHIESGKDIDADIFKEIKKAWTQLRIEEFAVLIALIEETASKQNLSPEEKGKKEAYLVGAKVTLVAENDRLEKAKPPYSDDELTAVGEKHAAVIEEAKKSSDQDAMLAEKIPDEHERKIAKWILDAEKEREKAGSAIAESLEAGGFAALLERLLTRLFQLIEYASTAIEKFLAKFEKKTPAKAPDRFAHSPIGKNGMFTIHRKFEEGKNGIELATETPDAKATWILDNEAEVSEIGEHSVTLQLGGERVVYEGIVPSVKKGDKIKQGAELGTLESKVLVLQLIDKDGKQRDPSEYLKGFTEEIIATAPVAPAAAAAATASAPATTPTATEKTTGQTTAPEKAPDAAPPVEEGDDEEETEGKANGKKAEKAPEKAPDLRTYLAKIIKDLDGKTIDVAKGYVDNKLPSPDGKELWTFGIQGNRIEIGNRTYTLDLPSGVTAEKITFTGNQVIVKLGGGLGMLAGDQRFTLDIDKFLPYFEELRKGDKTNYTIATPNGDIKINKA